MNAKILRIIKDVYSRVKNCVRGCNSYSNFSRGVIILKQREVISPILVSCFIEDMESFCKEVKIAVY